MSKGLTSFRALAFFLIFFFHSSFFGSGQLGFKGGYLGIQAFFVLSGFLLTPILLNMKSKLNAGDFFIHFYGRRALRIFPLYYSYLIIVAAISACVVSQNTNIVQADRFLEQLPWTMTYTYDFFHASSYFKHTVLATHFWSLAVEEQFYLIWPFAIFLISANHLKKFLMLVILTGPLIRFLLGIVANANILPVLSQTDLVIYVLPFSHFDAFAIGGYFALYGKSRNALFVGFTVLIVLTLGMVTSWLSTGQAILSQFGYAPLMKDSYKFIWGYSIFNLMFANMLVQIRNGTFMTMFLENPLLVYLGTISYGLYVFHLPILWLVYSNMNTLPEIVRVFSSLLITIMISAASYEFMEKRFINIKDLYFAKVPADRV